MKAAKLQPLTKADYELALSQQTKTPVKLTEQQYAKLKSGQLLTEAELAQAKGQPVTMLSNYDQGGSAYDAKYAAPAPLPDFNNPAVPASMAEGSPWWADPSQQWQPYQGKVAEKGKVPPAEMTKPKDAAKYSGFEDDSTNVGGADASKGAFKGEKPASKPASPTEAKYSAAFGVPVAPAPAAPTASTAAWKPTGDSMAALDYARSMGTRASNRARWDDSQNRWVTEFEDLGLTPTGLPKGGAVGKAIRDTGRA